MVVALFLAEILLQVSIVTKTECINPVHTVVSYLTSFATVTETREYQNTFTHVDVFQHVSLCILMKLFFL